MTSKTIPITCTSSHLVEVEKLQPIQGELKKRTREQLHSLRSLIIKHGFSFPIYIWENEGVNYTLDGHGRDFITKELIKEGYLFEQKDGDVNSKLPAIFIDAKDRRHAKEKLLAVNSSFGTITDEGLYAFLFEENYELKIDDIKANIFLPDISFSDFETKFVLDQEEDEAKEYQFIFSQSQLKNSIKDNFPEFKTTKEIVNGIIDIPLAMHQFNMLCSGKRNVGTDISLLFNPHRLETKVNNRKYSAAEAFIKKDKGLLSSLSQWMSKQHEIVHHSNYIKEARVGTGTQIAHEFKPYLARDIYLDYCQKGAKILDPCAGWGGRMLGFVSSLLGGEYFATDPSTKTYKGLLELKDFLLSSELEEIPTISLFNEPFEDLKLEQNYFDFAFTSPPYFDTELYTDEETQAFNRYKTIEEFNENFLTQLISKTIDALVPGGRFLINIGGSQYRFDVVVNDICEKLNLKVKEVFKYKIGKGDSLVSKYKGSKLENTIKANDLFFEISK